jgi:hypothetical protein
VHLRLKASEFDGLAQTVTEPRPITDFLQVRLERHPKMIGAILQSKDYPRNRSARNLNNMQGILLW